MDCEGFEVEFSIEDESTNGTGTTDHRELTNRDSNNQHPISAITGLQEALDELKNESNNNLDERVTALESRKLVALDETENQKMIGPLDVKNQFDLYTDNNHSFQIGFDISSNAYFAGNTNLSIQQPTYFTKAPSVSEKKNYSNVESTSLVTKEQVAQALADVNSGEGTNDYLGLINKPSINNVELTGNKSLNDLGIQAKGNYVVQQDLAPYALKAETLSGYGITDAYNIQQVDNLLNEKLTKTTADSLYASKNNVYSKQEVDSKISAVYKFKGSIGSYSNLPENNNDVGDTYNVEDTGANYSWTGTSWDKLSETIDLSEYVTQSQLTEVEGDVASLDADKLDKQQAVSDAGKYLKINTDGSIIPAIIPNSSDGVSNNYGIEADYAVHHGILDCPRGLIEYNATGKNITVKSGMVLQCAGATTQTTIGSDINYTIESMGKVVLFMAQGSVIEAGSVYYQTEEPDNGVENYLAWWNPEVGLWQFKSNDTGNVWRTAVATPFATVNASENNITSINYIGYRILNDDIIAQQSEIENLQNIVETLINRLNVLEAKNVVVSEDIDTITKISQADYDALETKNAKTMYTVTDE